MRGLLITGTDTGVGKTLVGCGLATSLTALGKTVGVLKPVETGCSTQNETLYPEDALRLAAFAQTALSLEQICPYRFAPPVAPSVAATLANTTIEPQKIIEIFKHTAATHDFTIVEGAGGLLVPLVGRYTFADLARDLHLPLLVVVGSKLGALNHTLLTLHVAQSLALPVVGYIVNHPTPTSDIAIQTNTSVLANLTDTPCLGVLPFLTLTDHLEQNRMLLREVIPRSVNLTRILSGPSPHSETKS